MSGPQHSTTKTKVQQQFPNTGNPDALLTKEQLRKKLNLPSTRSIDELMRRRVIPTIRLGWRTVRFDWAAVRAAIEKVTVQAVS